MSLAAKLPYDHAYAGGYPGIGSQPLPTDADALDYLARVKAADGAGVETAVAVTVDAFFRDAKESGVFSALKACCILAGARTLAGALVPVVGDAPTNVADGFVQGDFSRTAGLTGDGATTYLDTGRTQNSDPQNDVHISVFITASKTAADVRHAGTTDTSALSYLLLYEDNSFTGAYVSSNSITDVSNRTGVNLVGGTRDSSSQQTARVDGVSNTTTFASKAPSTLNSYVFCRNFNGAANAFSDATIAFYSIGTSLSLADLETAVTSLMTAIGNALNVPFDGGGSSVNVAPTVTLQPTNATASEGSTATFTSAASGSPTPTVQWQLSTDGGSSWADIGGATSSPYTTPTLLLSDDQNQYRAVWSNSEGTATSNAATLTTDYFYELEWLEVGADAFNPTDLLLN